MTFILYLIGLFGARGIERERKGIIGHGVDPFLLEKTKIVWIYDHIKSSYDKLIALRWAHPGAFMLHYHYVQAIVKTKDRGVRWQRVDIQDMTIEWIVERYRQAQIQLSHPAQEFNGYITLEGLIEQNPHPDVTFNQWLASLGEQSLPIIKGTPEIDIKTVDQRDVWHDGFDVQPIRIGTHPDIEFTKDKLPDLLLTKEGIDYHQLYRYSLVSVNGWIHRTGFSESGLHVKEGAKTGTRMNETQIAITTFDGVGELDIIDLKEDMLYRPKEQVRHYRFAHLDLGVDTDNKSVILVLGGYPHVLDDTYIEIGNGLIQIDFNNYPMIQRYYDAKDAMDLSSLPYNRITNNDDQRNVSDLLESEEWIKAYLNLAHSFAVIVDTPHLYAIKHKLQDTQLPGKFIAHQLPHWPLKSLRGRWLPYVAQQQDGQYLISCQNNLLANYQFESTGYRELQSVTNQKVPYRPYIRDHAFLLEIGRDL